MALKVTATAQGGISVSGAYVRITDVLGYKNYEDEKYYMTIGMAVFKDAAEAAKPNGQRILCPDFDREKCELSLTSQDNPLMQAYAYLKTLDKFSGAIDV